MDESRTNTNSQDSPWPGLEGSHHLHFYNIFCAFSFRDFQVGNLEIPEIGTLATLEAHNFFLQTFD